MFISKAEKDQINSRIQSLGVCIDNLMHAVNVMSASLKEITDAQQIVQKRKRERTEAQKEKQREYIRAYNARKKAERAQKAAA